MNIIKFKYTFKLPDDVTGNMVLLQWHWISANSCMSPGYNQYPFPPYFEPNNVLSVCYGNNLGEQFWNCAKITLLPKSPSAPVASPVASLTQSPVSIPVTSPTKYPVSPPVTTPTKSPVVIPATSPSKAPGASPASSPVC
jgi:hypothetical protein